MTWDGKDRRSANNQSEILVRFTKLESMIENQNSIMERNHNENRQDIKTILNFIDGNGVPGAKLDIDRLKTQAKVNVWFWAAVGILAIKEGWQTIFGK